MIKSLTKRSYLRTLFFALLTMSLSLGTVGCDDDDGGTTPDDSCTPPALIDETTAKTITGTLTFTYAGVPITSAQWPHSADVSDDVAGFFRIGLLPAIPSGGATGGPAYLIGGTGMGSGMKYCWLDNGTFKYQFQNVADGTYLVCPTYENIRDANNVRKSVGLGHWSNATVWGYGTPITVANDAHASIDMYCDMAIGAYAYDAMRRAATGIDSGTVVGSITVDDVSKWPTGAPAPGQSYLALVGYKDYATKADAIAANGGAGAAPDLFVMIPKPATAGVNIMAFVDKTHIKFGNPSVDQTYQCILIDKFTFTSYSDPGAAPLAQYQNPMTSSKSATFNATNPILVWQTNITLP